jgi:SAM-dependent methyltransferase
MWNQRYLVQEYVYGTAPNQFLETSSKLLKAPARVLCLAAGEGRNAVFLAKQGHHVLAVDQSQVGLDKAIELAKKQGTAIETEARDLADFEIEPGGFDAIISIFCHTPAPLRRALHRRVINGLKPGGLFLLEAFTPAQLELGTGGPRKLELLMSLSELREELIGLEFIQSQELLRDVTEGSLHKGEAAVVQVIGRKP